MSKEYDKFVARYKALAVDRSDEVATLNTKMRKAWMYTNGSGIEHLSEALARARKDGVTGDRIQQFAQNPHVADALKTFHIAVAEITTLQTKLLDLTREIERAKAGLGQLKQDIVKDLTGRSGRSESKAEIEKLQDDVDEAIKAASASAGVYAKKSKAELEFTKNVTARLDKLAKAAPEVGAAALDATLLPQAIVDRNRKRSRSRADVLVRAILAACDKATTQRATDPAAATATLKAAAATLPELRTIRDEYIKAYDYSVVKVDLLNTKDGAAATEMRDTFVKLVDIAEDKLRDAAKLVQRASA